MARIARVVVPGYPHDVTQRGTRPEEVFFTDADRLRYLELLKGFRGVPGTQYLSLWNSGRIPGTLYAL